MCCFDNKIHILNNGYGGLALGYYGGLALGYYGGLALGVILLTIKDSFFFKL